MSLEQLEPALDTDGLEPFSSTARISKTELSRLALKPELMKHNIQLWLGSGRVHEAWRWNTQNMRLGRYRHGSVVMAQCMVLGRRWPCWLQVGLGRHES